MIDRSQLHIEVKDIGKTRKDALLEELLKKIPAIGKEEDYIQVKDCK